MKKKYLLLKEGHKYQSTIPGEYAGWGPGKIFGKLDCKSGMRMKKENRVFFLTLEDAVNEGYRPCMKCKPIDEEDFDSIKNLVPQYKTLAEYYKRDKK